MEEETIESISLLVLINLMIDKGITVNAWIRVSLVGIGSLAIKV